MDAEERELLQRCAVALEKLVEHFIPAQRKERRPATLGTAAYGEEERQRLKLREQFRKKTPEKPPR